MGSGDATRGRSGWPRGVLELTCVVASFATTAVGGGGDGGGGGGGGGGDSDGVV